ncbi:hypothetical protein BH11MYX1_BH11MYX1_37370 [soil metagenome]
MRTAAPLVAVLALFGCPGNPSTTTCETDSDCGGDVCARDGECLPGNEIRGVKVTWTIGGKTADATSCASAPDFYIDFYGSYAASSFGYAPVPCLQSQFFIDKLPTSFDQVELGATGLFDRVKRIDNTNTASFDLSL